jgi:hypothetical protein
MYAYGVRYWGNADPGSSPCANPFAGSSSWLTGRTDQGVDYGVNTANVPVRAICNATVIGTTTNTGWPGNVFIFMKLTAGPWSGKCMYVAEHITNPIGDGPVTAGETIGFTSPDSDGSLSTEWGWAAGPGAVSTPYPPGADHNIPTEGGLAFARYLISLGAPVANDPGPGAQYAGASC